MADNFGTVTIRNVSIGKSKGEDLNQIHKTIKEAKEWIECMAYSPDSTKFAVGSHDNNIYVFLCPNYTLYFVFKGHSSYITSFDWNMKGDRIRSTCGAYELLFWDVPGKK